MGARQRLATRAGEALSRRARRSAAASARAARMAGAAQVAHRSRGRAVAVRGAPAVLTASDAAVLISLGRPIFFRQRRPGRFGQPFEVLKLRTMRPGAEPDAQRLTP